MNTMRMVIAFTLIFGALLAQENNQAEVRQVKQVVQTAYIDGFQNLGNLEDIEEGFHPGFTLLYIQNDQMLKLPLYNWLAGWKKRRAENPGYLRHPDMAGEALCLPAPSISPLSIRLSLPPHTPDKGHVCNRRSRGFRHTLQIQMARY